MAKLGEVCKVSASSKIIDREKVWLLNLEMVEQQTGRIIEYNYVKAEELNGSITQFDTENILYSKLRPNLNKVVLPEEDGFCTSELLPLRVDADKLDRFYLVAFLRSDNFVNWAVSKTAGAKMPRLGTKDLLNADIPLPCIEKQKEIAKQFQKLNELIFLRKQQLAILDELVKARFVETFGEPVSNTKSLPVLMGSEFFKLSNGKAVPEAKRFEDGVPAYGGNGISWHTDDALRRDNTLVVGRVGFQSGNVRFAKGPLWITDNAMYVSWYDSEKYDLTFLCELMQQVDFSRYQDAGDLKKITQKPFMNFEYLCPPLCQQQKFTAFVERVDQQKQVVQQSLDKLELMKKALMQEYFG